VCNDLHYGVNAPEICPTCLKKNAYVEIASGEAQKIMSLTQTSIDKSSFGRVIREFAVKSEFQVNPDQERVDLLLEGMFNNEASHGLKYCPCRLIEKDFEKDIGLICPCNFLVHETYQDKMDGECWCGLFVKKEKT
jgi:ferredoxin-thioredoxin reductase catalytic subunit